MNYDTDILFINRSFTELRRTLPFFTLRPNAKNDHGLLLSVKRLALLLYQAWLLAFRYTKQTSNTMPPLFKYVGGLGTYLERVCPSLTELIIVLRPGPLGATINDLGEAHLPVGASPFLEHQENLVKFTFEQLRAEENWKNLKVTFMRTEKWLN
jgi:hypothetical protein